MDASGYTLKCPTIGGYPYACVLYPSPPADAVVAERNGLCLGMEICTSLAMSLPGGIDCFDASGNPVAP